MATEPKAELVSGFRDGNAGGSAYAEALCAYAPTKEAGMETAHRSFKFAPLGWAVNSELPTVDGFEAATAFIRPEDMAESIAAGPDVEAHVAIVKPYVDAGFDHIVLTCPGQDQAAFIGFFASELKPALDALR